MWLMPQSIVVHCLYLIVPSLKLPYDFAVRCCLNISANNREAEHQVHVDGRGYSGVILQVKYMKPVRCIPFGLQQRIPNGHTLKCPTAPQFTNTCCVVLTWNNVRLMTKMMNFSVVGGEPRVVQPEYWACKHHQHQGNLQTKPDMAQR